MTTPAPTPAPEVEQTATVAVWNRTLGFLRMEVKYAEGDDRLAAERLLRALTRRTPEILRECAG